MRSRKKMWIAFALFVGALMLFRLAWAMAADNFSVVLMSCAAALFIASMVVFAIYFKE